MKAEERTIAKILTENITYEIPPYQRPYSWTTDNVRQLLEDVWEAYEESSLEYFIGSLITVERERDKRYDVVDGQQRLTTLNLLLASLRNRFPEGAIRSELEKRILPRDVFTGEAERPRLLLRAVDREVFQKFVLEPKPLGPKERAALSSPQQHLVENLEVVDRFWNDKSEAQLRGFAKYMLEKVYVVFVTTESLTSAYRLFNVLNARGLPLSNADLIKNQLFAQLGPQTSRSGELESRWLRLEDELGLDRLDTFLGHHRTSVKAMKARGNLHEEMQPLIESASDPFAFLDEVITSAENYMRIVGEDFEGVSGLRALRALRRVEYDEWIPPLLAFLNQPVTGLDENEFITLLEKITMQNWIRRLGRSARLTVYFQLINAIRERRPADEIRQIFRNRAQNNEFVELLSGEVYRKPFDLAVLLRLEEAAQDESVTKTFSGELTIEHVLPQTPSDPYWSSRFESAQHREWVHRLGNLALLSGRKNYRAQNFDFERKKKVYTEKNRKVSFDLTREVCDQSEWGLSQVAQRQARLIQLARQTWTID